jgi:PAS domain S-box-containing protein
MIMDVYYWEWQIVEKLAEQTQELQKENTLLKAEIERMKKAEKALRESEEKYRTIFNSMDESLCIIEMIFDYKGKPRMRNVEGKLISQLAPQTAQKLFEIYGKVALTGEAVRIVEGVFWRKSYYDLYVLKIGGQDSRKVAVLAYDINKRKRNEEKLIFQANLLSSVHDAIVAVDENNKITYWNEMAEKMFGFSAQEAIRLEVGELSTIKGTVHLELPGLSEDGSYMGEFNCRRKDGVIITTDAHCKVLVNNEGEYKGKVISLRNITERKRKEEELEALKDNLAVEVEFLTKFHSITTGFIKHHTSLENMLEEILDAAIELTQADKGNIQLKDEQSGHLINVAYRGFKKAYLNNFKNDANFKGSCEIAYKNRERKIVVDVAQSPIYIGTPKMQLVMDAGIKSLQSTPLISSSGNVVGVLSTFYLTLHQFEERELRMLDLLARQAADAIERTRAEETIHQSEKRALALVEELCRMDQNKNHFLSMLSHELRNPLASIMMSISLLDRVTPGGEQFRLAKEIIERQTTQLSRLVDDLLDVTRITQNKISLKKERVNLNELISKALEDYQEQLVGKGVRIEVELTPIPLHLEADPARLTQVIGNLLNNAAKFTEIGDTVQVSVCKDEEKPEAVICVKDDGLGIKPDILPDLFLPFIQVDSSLDRSSGGLGLGLAIVKGMVDLHGGSVAAASEGLGNGAQFSIRLPLPAIPDNNQVKLLQTDRKPSRTLRILVIDDIPDVAEIICSLLRVLGHEVISANSGSEGIAKAKAFHPEILICDIGMPGMNGYEVAESFFRDEELKDIFRIALTGYTQPDDLERARAAGFNRHLAKPVDITILEQTLAEVL